MSSVICTLFEGHYHYGVAGLVNSLYKKGFRGTIYAGYRGALPQWSNTIKENNSLNWKGAKTLCLGKDLQIHFLPIQTKIQFTNYKPEFVLQLMLKVNLEAKRIYYFDPDIVIKCNWKFFEEWTLFGIALVHEVINNDMPGSHPIRQTWKRIVENSGFQVKRNISSYINAGFFGLERSNLQFAELYRDYIEISIKDYNAQVDKFVFDSDRTNPFFAKDQDALNLAAMSCDADISEYGPEAMDFIHGGKVMSHAVGSPKPWKKKFMLSFLKGSPPSPADKEYWKNANGVIKAYNDTFVNYKLTVIKLASYLGRFYRKY